MSPIHQNRKGGLPWFIFYPMMLAIIAAGCYIIFMSVRHTDDRSDFYVEGTETVTATYSEGIDYEGDFGCNLDVAVEQLPEHINDMSAETEGENCVIEMEFNRGDGNGFQEMEPGEASRFTYLTDRSVDFAFRLCYKDRNLADADCEVFRFNAA